MRGPLTTAIGCPLTLSALARTGRITVRTVLPNSSRTVARARRPRLADLALVLGLRLRVPDREVDADYAPSSREAGMIAAAFARATDPSTNLSEPQVTSEAVA